MGIRGELFSTRVSTEGRTYFFNVKENRMGDIFLTIVESKPTEADNFDRRSIVIFRDDVKEFIKAFQGALSFMESPKGEAGGRSGVPASLHFDGTPRERTGVETRRSRPPAGFAGSEDQDQTPKVGEVVEKKRRIVVRKKNGSGGGGAPAPGA